MIKVINNKTESETLLHCFREQDEDITEICILVGYCRYSAFVEIAKDENARKVFLKANVKIIMGMDIDPKIQSLYISYGDKKDVGEKREDFLKYTISNKDDNIKVIELFKEKCEKSTLEIRKSKDPTHSKLYLFKYNRKSDKGAFLIGSSNFTKEGLFERREINVYGKDDFDKFDDFFNEEWNNSTTILDFNNQKEFFENAGIESNNRNNDEINYPTPYEIYLKVIYEYFSFFSNEKLLFTPKDYNYANYKYQIDAIKSGIKSVMLYNGVLISDVVGLGKSIIASTIAKNLLEKKAIEEIVIVSPPKITYSWENYDAEFKLNAKVFSVGLLNELYDYIKKYQKNRLIIIDEAHRFVNNKTNSYGVIKEICSTNKVMLLTATPMHNTTSDIFSLVDIFDRILTTNSNIAETKNKILKEERVVKLEYKKDDDKDKTKEKIKEISKQILSLINPIIIRRTRKDLIEDLEYRKDLEEQKTEFNKVENPKLHDYNLGDISKLYADTFEKISPDHIDNNEKTDDKKFKAVRYEPLIYLKYSSEDEKKNSEKIIKRIYGENINIDFASLSSRNLTKFMKHLLIRRFESSVYAFKKSIDNMIDKYENIKNWIGKGYYPIYKKGDALYIEELFIYNDNANDDDIDDDYILDYDKAYKEYDDLNVIENVKEVLKDEFFKEFDDDLKILKEIKNDWKDIGIDKDGKFKKLIEILKKFKNENGERKIIIFSEFKDTADYLYNSVCEDDELRKIFKPIKSTSKSKNRDIITANFDASLEDAKWEDDYFLLIATDALSEGINLHRAGIIINYDIPYNPTRVIQRVGRINRIGRKLFDKIYIHNFIPRAEAQKDIKNWQISNFKLNLINAIFGNDTKILKSDDEIDSLFSLKKENDILDDDEASWDNEYRDIYNKLKNDDKLLERIKSMDNNIVLRREANFEGMLEVVRSANGVFGALLKNSKIDFNIENIFKILKADKNEKYLHPSEKLQGLEEELKRRKNVKKNKSKSDVSLILDEFAKKLDNDSEKDYIQKLIYIIDNKYLSKKTIKDLNKSINNLTIESLQKIVSNVEAQEKFNYYTNNLNSVYLNSYLIVKEEFSETP